MRSETRHPPSSGERLSVGVHPGIEPRLLSLADDVEDAYRAAGGHVGGLRGIELLRAIELAGLRGRGGAAFPTAVKLRAVAEGIGPRYVVANGEEGEPASVKDRWLLRRRPHLVLDGLVRAAELVGADRGYVYVSDPLAADAVERALADVADELSVPVRVHMVDRGYVAGEETAVVRAINGGPAKPLDKPPRPYERGVDGRPTAVCNVETLANVALLAAGDPELPSVATFLLTVSGACERPGLYEVPYGVPLGATTELLAGADPAAHGYLMGGFFAGLLARGGAGYPLDTDELRSRGSGLGCGAVVVLGADDCAVAAAADVMAYFARENADQCGPCIRGTSAMSMVLGALTVGEASRDQLARFATWSTSLRGRGACGTLDGAASLAATLLDQFPAEVDAHLTGPCARCAALPISPDRTRFALDVPLSSALGVLR